MPEFKLPENFETYPEARKKAFLTMKELKEQEETHRAVKRWLFQLLKHLSSKQEKL